MAKEITYDYGTASATLYAKAATPLNTGTWATGVVTMTEDSNRAGYYTGDVALASAADGYLIFVQDGASPADDDTAVATQDMVADKNAAAIATVDTVADAIKAKTDNLPSSPAAVGSAMTLTSGERSSIGTAVWASTTRTLSSFGTLIADIWSSATRTITGGSLTTDPPTAAATATATRTALATELARIDVTLSTRASTAAVTTAVGTLLSSAGVNSATMANLDAAITSRLAPTTAGRTLDVDTDGNVAANNMRGTDNAYTGTPPTADAIGTDAAGKILETPAQKIVTNADGEVVASNATDLTDELAALDTVADAIRADMIRKDTTYQYRNTDSSDTESVVVENDPA